ncbi:unnamed protein product [Allacma fusca]|uniref:Uncharacterized protein n=1 Tax=Allacma fusca TaxID=39272 RepID=A0A8J2L8Q2_9HEXA|nr:unnamed protein product [Allacma fusca]
MSLGHETYFLGSYLCWYNRNCHRYFTCLPNNCWKAIQTVHRLGCQLGKHASTFHLFNELTSTDFSAHGGSLNVTKHSTTSRKVDDSKSGSPFQQVEPWRLFQTVFKFLVGDLKFTKSTYPRIKGKWKWIILKIVEPTPGIANMHVWYTEFRVSRTPPFKFILSDGVTSVKLKFTLYTNPFDLNTWISFLVANILVAIILALNAQNPKFLDQFIIATLALLGNFVEQGLLDCTRKYTSKSMMIVLTISLLSGLVLTNGFKGFLKSSFGFANNYVTNWRYLKELENFTLYFPRRDFSRKTRSQGDVVKDSSTCNVKCRAFGSQILYQNGDDLTKFLGDSEDTSQHYRFQCVDHNDLDSFLQQKLSKPKNAFVVYTHEFNHYWRHVKTKMKENDGLRFAHNQHVQDDLFLQKPVSLFIPNSIPLKHNYVGTRAKIMLSSGLFWFWEKWHRIRFPRCLESDEKLLEETGQVTALSMNSSVVLIFRGLLGSGVICVFVLIVENIWSCFCNR